MSAIITVIVLLAEHPIELVKVNVAVPSATPITSPDAFTVNIAVSELLQVPFESEPVKEIVFPSATSSSFPEIVGKTPIVIVKVSLNVHPFAV